jgi:replicative superfamily II helicase
VRALTAQGLSARAVEVWHGRGITELLPLQAVAVAEYGVLQGRSAIVFAPTSAGKTLVAELAALRHLEARRRVVFLVPTKALAEERGGEFAERFGALGARVVVATRERPEADARVLSGDWDILVAIYEKVRSHLVARPTLLSEVGLVVADEMQMLGELGRGDTVELILTKMAFQSTARQSNRTQFMGLSAVLADAARIGAWLGCDVLTWPTRPVPLREGVLCAEDGVFRFREHNTGTVGCETLLEPEQCVARGDECDVASLLLKAAEALAGARGESVLLFAPTKRLAREWALALAERLELPPATRALETLTALEPSHGRALLAELLQAGVAYHSADLPWALRAAVERAYDAGEVRALVATSTLAQGVNLTGRNVIIAPFQIENDRLTSEPTGVALSRGRFQNAGGRAGRWGREQDFGRAILVAATRDEAERMMAHYIGQAPEPLEPGLERADLAPILLDLVASKTARRPREIEEFLLATHTGLTRWQALEAADWQERWLDPLERLEKARLIDADPEGDLSATGLGLEVARAGVAIKTARHFERWLARVDKEPSLIEVLWCACRAPDAAECALPLRSDERRSRALIEELAERLEDAGSSSHPMNTDWLQPKGGTLPSDLLAAKRALLLWAWLGDAPTEEIEERFGVHVGAIENLAGHLAWLVETLANLATALAHPDARTDAWRALARRLPNGLPAGAERWSDAHVPGLGRSHVRTLAAEGIWAPEDLKDIAMEALAHLIPAALAESLTKRRARPVVSHRVRHATMPHLKRAPETKAPERDGGVATACAMPEVNVSTGTVRWLGREARLTPKPARLLAVLAAHAPEAVPYEAIEQAIWGTDEIVERQQISAHRRAVIRGLGAIDPTRAARLIEVRARQGLRLRIE